MKGKIIYMGEEWMLNSKASKLKRTSQYIEVRNWTLENRASSPKTVVTLVNNREVIYPGKLKGGKLYRRVGGKEKIKSYRFI